LGAGGVERWLLDMLAHGGVPAWDVDLCLLADQPGEWASRFEALGLRLLHCPLRPATTFAWRFVSLLRAERYRLVHSHVLYFSGTVLSLAAAAGVPLRVAHAHNSQDGYASGALRRRYRGAMRAALARSANLVLGCSSQSLEQLTSDGVSAITLPYGVDLAQLSRFEQDVGERERLGFESGVRIIGSIGRAVPQKNQLFLIEAFRKSLIIDPALRLVLAADGPLRKSISARIEREALGAAIRLLAPGKDARRVAASCFDAFVLTSLWEGLPIALLEAQALGLPSLISDRVSAEAIAIEELVEKFGVAQDVNSWAGKMVDIARRPKLAVSEAVGKMRRAGFDAAETGHRLARIYENLGSVPRSEAA